MEMDSGNMTVTDLPGSIQLSTTNKDVTLDNVAGRIDITDRRGDIQARFPKPPKNEIRISDESGNITLTLPANSNFDITAVSRSGEIQSDFQGPNLHAVNSENSSTLSGSFGSRGPRITLGTTYGTITIRKAH
jgi:DUF4097 and DUF4098 domain-containing protein YvlB